MARRGVRGNTAHVLDLDVATEGVLLQIWGDGQGIVRGRDVGGENHAVGVGRARLVAHDGMHTMGLWDRGSGRG